MDRQVQGASLTEIVVVHFAAIDVRRAADYAPHLRRRRYADVTPERFHRDDYARSIFNSLLVQVDPEDAVFCIRKLVGQYAAMRAKTLRRDRKPDIYR